MKKFAPIVGIVIMYMCLILLILIVVLVPWLVLGPHPFTISWTVMYGLILLILVPLCVKWSINLGTITINNNRITYWKTTVENRKSYYLKVVDISDIKDIKIVSKPYVKKYDKNCNAKKILLFDLGNENYEYIIIVLYSKKQIQEIIDIVNQKRNELNNF